MSKIIKEIFKSLILLFVINKITTLQVPVVYENGSRILDTLEEEDLISKKKTEQIDEDASIEKPRPEVYSTPEECARPCTLTTSSKTCLYRFHVEQYQTLTRACQLCSFNRTNNCQCVLADGIERILYTVNRRLPGPNIEVCEHDNVIIDVENEIKACDLTIHWHGILQEGTQYYDGVPYVTQCPILHGNSFRYKWVARNPGTHFWHSHTGFQKMDGIAGGIVIRQAPERDPNSALYDHDLSEHVLLLQDWLHDLSSIVAKTPVNFLINGKGKFTPPGGIPTNTPLEEFVVQSGRKYRFRLINALASTCPVQIMVQGHDLKVIAADGIPVQPEIVKSIISFSAERYDFVINANQNSGRYWIQVKGLAGCSSSKIQQLAVLQYGSASNAVSAAPTYDNPLPTGKVLNPMDTNCDQIRTDAICVNQLKNALNIHPRLLAKQPDIKIFLPIRVQRYSDQEAFDPNSYTKFFIFGGGQGVGLMDNISYVAAPYPLISQYLQNSPSQFCNRNQPLSNCGTVCKCTHKISVPMNRVVELIIVDEIQAAGLAHPIHLHGFAFNVMKIGRLPDPTERISIDKAINLDNNEGIKRNFIRPPGKDTIAVPDNGYAAIRFISNNPGFWFIHCHFMHHLVTGMAAVIQVGNLNNLPSVPQNFPRCGNFQ